MKKNINYIHCLFVLLILGCDGFIGGGTHGSIKSYKYSVMKKTLQKSIEEIIVNGGNIRRDTPKYNIVYADGGKKDTLWDNYYNDTINYVTLFIKIGNAENEYTLRYSGGKEYWDTSKQSSIFIAYAYDENRNGGSVGNGGVKWYNFRLKKKLTEPFEKEIISKIDSLLGVKHTEE